MARASRTVDARDMADLPAPPAPALGADDAPALTAVEKLRQRKLESDKQAAAAAAAEALEAGPPEGLSKVAELQWKNERRKLVDAVAGGSAPPMGSASSDSGAAVATAEDGLPPTTPASPSAPPLPPVAEEGGEGEDEGVPVHQTEAGKTQGVLKTKGFEGQGSGWQKQWCVLADGKLTCYKDKDARTLFEEMDEDKSGALDAGEIKKLCRLMDFKLKNKAVEQAMEEMDTGKKHTEVLSESQ